MSSSWRPEPRAEPESRRPEISSRSSRARHDHRPSPGGQSSVRALPAELPCPSSTTDGQNLSIAAAVGSCGVSCVDEPGCRRSEPVMAYAMLGTRGGGARLLAFPFHEQRPDSSRPPRNPAAPLLGGARLDGVANQQYPPGAASSDVRAGAVDSWSLRRAQHRGPPRALEGHAGAAQRAKSAHGRRARKRRSCSAGLSFPTAPRHNETRCGGLWMSAHDILGSAARDAARAPIWRRQEHGQRGLVRRRPGRRSKTVVSETVGTGAAQRPVARLALRGSDRERPAGRASCCLHRATRRRHCWRSLPEGYPEACTAAEVAPLRGATSPWLPGWLLARRALPCWAAGEAGRRPRLARPHPPGGGWRRL